MRRTVAAAVVVALCGGATLALASPAAAVTPVGSYQAVTPTRLLDTRPSAGGGGAVAAGHSVSFSVPGAAGATAVLNVTVTAPTGSGFVTAYADGTTRPGVSNLNFVKGQTVPNLVVVPVGADGKVALYNGSTGTVQLIADLSGTFSAGTPASTQQGAFGAVAPARLLDTRSGTGGVRGPVKGGTSIAFTVAGAHGVPATVSAVVLNVTVTAPAGPGYISAYADGGAAPRSSNLNFVKGQTVPNLVVVPVGADGKVALLNGSNDTVQLIADVAGYFTPGDPVAAGDLGALAPSRLLDTRSAGGAVGAGGTLTLTVAGRGGVPRAGVRAVVLNVTVTGPTGPGDIVVWAGGTRPRASSLNFVKGQTVPNLVIAPVSSSGTVSLYNQSSGTVQLIADVSGYLIDTGLAPPATTTSRYVSSLSAISDASATGEGCSDAKAAPRLVLLDVGAQTITAPLSAADPGVALVNTNPVVRVDYSGLVTALDGYISGFVSCLPSGATARIAVGTSNDGAYPGPYTAAQRGKDWATEVVNQLDHPTGVTVVGADDIESYFASSEADAETWVTSYLDNTAAALIDNGSADNCPAAYGSTAECGAVLDDNGKTKTWTRAQYVRLTYGLGPGRISVLPQIYYPAQAVEWLNIDTTAQGKLTFEGSLTQYGVCGCTFPAPQGWAALYHALSTSATEPSLPVATDLRPT